MRLRLSRRALSCQLEQCIILTRFGVFPPHVLSYTSTSHRSRSDCPRGVVEEHEGTIDPRRQRDARRERVAYLVLFYTVGGQSQALVAVCMTYLACRVATFPETHGSSVVLGCNVIGTLCRAGTPTSPIRNLAPRV